MEFVTRAAPPVPISAPPSKTMRLPLSTLAVLLCAGPLAAQTDHRFAIDEGTSVINWDLVLNVGDIIEQPSVFAFDGTLVMETTGATAPFGSGVLSEGLVFTAPTSVGGQIPNPIPFLPPLGSFSADNLQARMSASSFVIAPDGSFTAIADIITSAGTATATGILGSGSFPLAGVFQTTQPIDGTLTQVGTSLVLNIDLDVTLTMISPIPGITGSITLQGPIDAYTTTTAANPMTLLSAAPLTGGSATLTVEHATPGAPVYLAASTVGLGSIAVPALGVITGLAAPQQVGAAVLADGSGNASFTGTLPAAVIGKSLWFQALQTSRVSNVSGTWVQ